MDDSTCSVFVQQLAALQQRHPTKRIVAFVPRPQLGMAIQTALTRQAAHIAGFETTTVTQYAEELVGLTLRSEGFQPLEPGPQLFLTVAALQDVPSSTQNALVGNRSASGLIRPLARTFDTLRTHRISSDQYKDRVAQTARQEAQGMVYVRYEELLKKHDFYDTAGLLERATEYVEHTDVTTSQTVFVLLDVLQLTTVSRAFLHTLLSTTQREERRAYRLGIHQTTGTDSLSPTPDYATVQFSKLPYESEANASPSSVGRLALEAEDTLSKDESESVQCWTATGKRREVQAVFEDIVKNECSLDTVEIAFSSEEPYLSYIDSMSQRYDIPVSLSTGRALSATRPGQMLQGILEWIADGFPVSTLIKLLRTGLLQIDEPIGPGGKFGELDSKQAASLLAQRRYGTGPQSYENALVAWIDELESELVEIQESSDEAPWLQERADELNQKKAAIKTLNESIGTLLLYCQFGSRNNLFPSDLAQGLQNIIEEFGGVDKPTGPEDEHTPDEAARNRLMERLETLKDTETPTSQSLRSLATDMSTWLDLTPYIRAQRPRPGEAHVVPLQSAGFAGRDHLYVVGLDAASIASQHTDDPLLTDEERETISETGMPLPLRRNRPDAEAWLTARALARHAGTVTLSASTYDIPEDEERFESPLYLRIQEAVQDATLESMDSERTVHHPLATSATTALTPLDQWMTQPAPSPSAVDEALKLEYPWIRRGLDAARARASDQYTKYDGLLSSDAYSNLDPLRKSTPVSAGQLEKYARSPFAYFLRHVLDVEPLDEPALDDVAWLDALQRGQVLHDTFRRFMSSIERQPIPSDEKRLRRSFLNELGNTRKKVPPPSEVVFSATKRQLWNDALLFLNAEIHRSDDSTPAAFEWGFGMPPHRRHEHDHSEPAEITLGPIQFRLRGRIDRIDRHSESEVSLWDYKTGSSRNFDAGDLLKQGSHLQWALYAYAYHALEGDQVVEAGYFFTSTDEMGKRMSDNPNTAREEVTTILKRMKTAISEGVFPVTDADDLRYNYSQLFGDFELRKSQLRDKSWPTDRTKPPPLMEG